MCDGSGIAWPGQDRGAYLGPETRVPPTVPTHWLGSLPEGQTDATGLLYRRHRYFNPATAQFTQEAPIGLAGGLNLYGFANGDPVNFSDPFGLCPCVHLGSIGAAISQAIEDYQFEQMSMVVGATGPLSVGRGIGRVVPTVTNSKLGRLVGEMFKGARSRNPIGTGSTADAIREETATGNRVGGRFHTEKGQGLVNGFRNWLARNPDADHRDRLVAQSLLDDLREALSRIAKRDQ